MSGGGRPPDCPQSPGVALGTKGAPSAALACPDCGATFATAEELEAHEYANVGRRADDAHLAF